MKEICPVALLQAILLKLEENLIYQPDAFQSLMSQYALYLHEAIRNELVTSDEMAMWPLDEGIQRVSHISQALMTRRPLTSAMVMNYCQVVDRFGAHHELQWLLEPPFGENVGGDTGLLTQTDLYIYQVDWPWCQPLREEVLMKLRKAVRSLQLLNYSGGPKREEQTAYFKYITENWENLPDFTIFVHPDADEHQGPAFLALQRALKLIHTQSQFAYESLAYYPLAQQMVVDPMRTWGTHFSSIWQKFWLRVFGRPWESLRYEAPRCRWSKAPGYFLQGHAGDGRRESLPAAKATCAQLEDECGGVTCMTPLDPEEEEALTMGRIRHSCTARRGVEGLQESPEGEVSYLKFCGPLDHDFTEIPEIRDLPTAGLSATYHETKDAFLAEHPPGEEQIRGQADTRRRCDLVEDCHGFTCAAPVVAEPSTTKQGYAELMASQRCTLRRGEELFESPSGEVSFVKVYPAAPAAGVAHGKADASHVFQFYTGSQAIVRKDRLQWWPLQELRIFGADGVWCSNTTGLFEAVWHRMFGEPLSQHPREHDPDVPLYLKWGIPTWYSFGDEETI
ncbi:KH domain-containing protein [Durusdinium trenchii]